MDRLEGILRGIINTKKNVYISFNNPSNDIRVRYLLGSYSVSSDNPIFNRTRTSDNDPKSIVENIKRYMENIQDKSIRRIAVDNEVVYTHLDIVPTDQQFTSTHSECGICMGNLSGTVCRLENDTHVFHCGCLEKWAQTMNKSTISCPTCRKESSRILSGTFHTNNFFGKKTHLRGLIRYLNTLV